MFKVKNLIEKNEIDTIFWLEEDCGRILLKAKLAGQIQSSVIISINDKGLLVWEGIRENLGFQTITKANSLLRIRVEME